MAHPACPEGYELSRLALLRHLDRVTALVAALTAGVRASLDLGREELDNLVAARATIGRIQCPPGRGETRARGARRRLLVAATATSARLLANLAAEQHQMGILQAHIDAVEAQLEAVLGDD